MRWPNFSKGIGSMGRRLVTTIAAAMTMAAAASGVQAQGQTRLAAALQAQTQSVPSADYKIGPQDTLEINVFQLNDLNRTVLVDSSGRILLPLLGQVEANGKTSEELSSDIAARLSKSYVNNPQVTVVVKDAQGLRITVDGAVGQPGVYPLTGPTTLLQAVALAKGADSKMANLHKVTVFRIVGAERVSTSYDLKAIRDGRRPDPMIYGKDVIVVDTSNGRGLLRDLGSVAPIVSVLRWGF